VPRQLSTLPVAATLSKNTTLLPTPSYSLGLLFVYYIVLRIVRACVRSQGVRSPELDLKAVVTLWMRMMGTRPSEEQQNSQAPTSAALLVFFFFLLNYSLKT